MILILGVLAIIVAIVLWVAKAAIEFVYSFGGVGLVVLIIGLIVFSRGRRSSL